MAVNNILRPAATVVGALSAVVVPTTVSAQGADQPLVLSFEGAAGVGNHSNAYGQAKLGNGFDELDDDVAFVGSVGLSRSIDKNWDWSLSVSQLGYAENTSGDQSGSLNFNLANNSSRSEVDFTLGRKLTLGSATARLGVGLAYANASAEKGLDMSDLGSGYLHDSLSSKFQGIGPRLSLDVKSAPVGANGKLSVIGGVEVSLLAGQYQHSKGFEAYDGSPFAFDDNKTDKGNMLTAGVKLGVEFDANESTSFRAGVRHDITRMDQAALFDPDTVSYVPVEDGRTSFFVGMNVGF